MIMQYDDMVLQVVDRLKKVIPATPKPIASIVPMRSYQKDIQEFFNSVEQSRLLVTYSGSDAEGGRHANDFVKTLGENVQYQAHMIEVHICSKRYMYDVLNGDQATMLRLIWTIRAGLTGMKFYQRDSNGVVLTGWEYAATERMFHIQTVFDRSYDNMVVGTVRFQVLEVVPEAEDVEPDLIWGQYKEITIEEYSQENGAVSDTTVGQQTEEIVVD